MSIASFRFHAALSEFLARENRSKDFRYGGARAATLKNAIEALGVPHTEVGALTVNGAPATLQSFPGHRKNWGLTRSDPIFLADAHLRGLARFLRMLGFDTLYQNAFSDEEIRRLAGDESRIVLTRDRELLKCRDLARGCYARALKPEAQLREVAARYGLAASAKPFTLCLICNLPLEPVDKIFSRCPGCDRIYWPGTHYARMRAAIDGLR